MLEKRYSELLPGHVLKFEDWDFPFNHFIVIANDHKSKKLTCKRPWALVNANGKFESGNEDCTFYYTRNFAIVGNPIS